MKYHVFPGHISNAKVHDLYNVHFPKNPDFVMHSTTIANQVINFILSNRNNTNMVVILYFYLELHSDTNNILKCIPPGCKLKIVLFTCDYWLHLDKNWITGRWPGRQTFQRMFIPKDHYVVTFANNLAQLENLHRQSYTQYANRFIFCNIWSAYNSSFVEFNKNPIDKIVVAGSLNDKYYFERNKILALGHPGVMQLENKTRNELAFCQRLNQYLCCFASSVNVHSVTEGKSVNAHCLLQKYFEILASGSLLLCPDTERDLLEMLGLHSHVHCITANMDNIRETVNHILNPKNRKTMDRIRKNGQRIAKLRLTSDKKYSELMSKLQTTLGI